ncbi:RsmF rRNA methyltransferase first C-terminal domain-containing protein [Paenibacillus radicis (ex Xue et al. 2023)]|uniref:RsmB/NOP family class I SAM-dependent RNA methyltransferase n=1 Tax=Paenibacillus radicis (ex Xue et al. 2023) TaxID=2972489 RepID=A0ABT1YD85_9BACL|nr:RsmB/NOP family class I SAM-dependent RNA methyltransferase [Paenibacillus radicis (ex Xue et al. 2023)]MCR8631131.1 RsmB/NOP family class I SAM-dependent RNA methyltransferase [Paenibacillus radicis (ex Xue et al. 2023)]
MGSQLPEAFLTKMERMLGEEYSAFLASYEDTRWYGLRINTLKTSVEQFLSISALPLKPITWTPTGFYYNEADRPGKHPYYHAGLYYIQEPSAMAPVELLDVHPGERVLDLCAAPGGKSTQIAAKLAGQGILVTNDIHSDRVKALVKNIELSGVRNAVVLNEQPEKLQRPFESYFDKILIDAPCSGEGMFRKEEDMAKAWQPDWVKKYAEMQRELLKQAAVMLRAGGRIVYSTCTFSPEENEAMIAEFLEAHPRFKVLPIVPEHGFRSGVPAWVDVTAGSRIEEFEKATAPHISERSKQAVEGTVRLWPHLLQGEGHFAAVLEYSIGDEDELVDENPMLQEESGRFEAMKVSKQAKAGKQRGTEGSRPSVKVKGQLAVDLQLLYQFMAEHAPNVAIGTITLHGDHVYAAPEGLPNLNGIRVIRPGWYLGSFRKQRFEPSHALAMGLQASDVVRTVSLSVGDGAAIRYLKGETLEIPQERVIRSHTDIPLKGYCLVCIDGYPVGWGKWLDGMLKNEYPAGWRWT